MTEPKRNPKAFYIESHSEVLSFPTRVEAVTRAKERSREHRGSIEVTKGDGTVRMRFRDGKLETYAYDGGAARRPRW